MAYQVLARKWRPQNFEEVVGQDPITRTLQNALAAGRIAHAFLFSGPRGTGKTSVARILAKALNCVGGPTPHPDNTCDNCLAITNGSSLDVLEIDGASNRGIDEVRDLREKIKYLPAQGKYKVYIIDEVHMLTKEAFNALLKTLEEPPAHAVFILATTEPHKVPVTIMSRCQRYDFRRIPTALIQAYLTKLAGQEGWQIDAEGLALIARAAEGGLRDAQGFLDQVVTFGGEQVGAGEIARLLGVTDRGALMGALKALVHRQGPELLTLIDELYSQGHDLRRFYQDLVLYARHLLLAGLHPDTRHLVAVADAEWEELTLLARQTPALHLHNLLTVLLQGEEELRRTPQPRLALEVLLLRLIHLEPIMPIKEWLARLEQLAERLKSGNFAPRAGGQAPAERITPGVREPEAGLAGADRSGEGQESAGERFPEAGPTGSAGPLAETDLEEQWQAFLQFVQEKGEGPLYGKLSQCRVVELTDQHLKIIPGPTWKAGAGRQEARLNELVQSFFGPQYRLEIEAPAAKPAPKKAAAPRQPLDMAGLKQQALEVFGGRFVTPAAPEKEESQ